jgi:prevent-host-death family protein
MNIKEDIQPISFVKAHATEILVQINQSHRPLYVTQNGKAKAVIVDPESFENMNKAISILKLITLSEKELKEGKFSKQEDVFTEIENKYGWLK